MEISNKSIYVVKSLEEDSHNNNFTPIINSLTQNYKILEYETLVRLSINNEYNLELYDAENNLFDRLLISLKKSKYIDLWSSIDIIQYLNMSSQNYFRMIVDHFDYKTNSLLRLFEWNYKNRKIYIFTTCQNFSYNYNLNINKRAKINLIKSENMIKDEKTGKFIISKKGYSILRKYTIKNLCDEFMKLNFFLKLDEAKKFTINSNTSNDLIKF